MKTPIPTSKVNQALDLMDKDPALTAAAAARLVGIGRQSVYARLAQLKRQADEGRERCPCCDALLPDGQTARKLMAKVRKALEG